MVLVTAGVCIVVEAGISKLAPVSPVDDSSRSAVLAVLTSGGKMDSDESNF